VTLQTRRAITIFGAIFGACIIAFATWV